MGKFVLFLILAVQSSMAAPMKSGVDADVAYEQMRSDCDPNAVTLPYTHIGLYPDPKVALKTQEDLTTFIVTDINKKLSFTSKHSMDSARHEYIMTFGITYNFNQDLLYEDVITGMIDGLDENIPKPRATKSFWLIDGGTPENTYTSNDAVIDFVPKKGGLYIGQLFIKETLEDGTVICGGREFQISVSANPKVENKTQTLAPIEDKNLLWQKELKLSEAHKISKGSGVVVAVIDTGVNYNHLGLNNKVIRDSGASTGYDFIDYDKLPYDGLGHGSHVAGLIVGDQVGVAPQAKIIPYRVMDNTGKGGAKFMYLALKDAVRRNVNIINISMTMYDLIYLKKDYKNLIRQVLVEAEKKGIILVVAAGNASEFGATDLDRNGFFLPIENLSNVILVGARGTSRELAVYSNYGKNTVDIVAFGGDRMSLENEGKDIAPEDQTMLAGTFCKGSQCQEIYSYGNRGPESYLSFHGTSMAAPMVSGAIALMKSYKPNLSSKKILEVLINSTQKNNAYADWTKSSGELDIVSALKNLSQLK